ncbi:MAG: tetratricopeptide repeat protein [Polaromonas sp.]
MSRIDELKQQIAQLDGLIGGGVLTIDAARDARERLQTELLAVVVKPSGVAQAAADTATQQARPSARLVLGLMTFLLVFSAAGYAWLGNPAGLSVGPGSANPAETVDAAQIEPMIERLAQHLKTTPGDAEGWAVLGRSYSVLGRYAEAVSAYRKVVELRPGEAQGYADLADGLGSGNGNSLDGEPEELIAKALALDPDNVKALSLAGSAAFYRGDAAAAAQLWERALRTLKPDSAMARVLQSALAEARQRAGLSAPPAATAGPSAGATIQGGMDGMSGMDMGSMQGAAPAGADATIQGRVTLAERVKTLTAPEDTVFIFARPVQGGKAPLAVLRKQVKDLPFDFTLDDSLAVNPAMRLSTAREVQVGARISKSGNPMPQPGDLQGLTATVAVGAQGVTVEISEAVR